MVVEVVVMEVVLPGQLALFTISRMQIRVSRSTHSQRLLRLRSCREVGPTVTAQQSSVGSSRLPKPTGGRL